MLGNGSDVDVIPTMTDANTSSIVNRPAMDIKPDFKPNTISSQTISPEGSIVSPVSSQDSIEDRKRGFSDIQEEENNSTIQQLLVTPKRQSTPDSNEQPQLVPPPKLHKTMLLLTTPSSQRHPGENDLNVIDKEANDILDEIKKSIREAEISLQNTNDNDVENKKIISLLLESLIKAKSLILKLNLNKNLFKFQITSELEQNNIEKQILLRNLETFQNNLNSLMIDNNNLNDKNIKLIKYYKYLKYGKVKELKQKNLTLSKELDSLKNGANNYNHPGTQSSNSSSGRSSVAYLQQSGENRMLNTLGMLASQVLANEEPHPQQPQQQDKVLPPTFGSITSFKNHSGGGSDSLEDDEE